LYGRAITPAEIMTETRVPAEARALVELLNRTAPGHPRG